jgi:hypothetical protein
MLSVKLRRSTLVNVAMSDHDYGALHQALGWIECHAGVDAPGFRDIEELSSVVSNIAKHRETELPHQSQPDSHDNIVVDLLNPTRPDAPIETPGATGPSVPPGRGLA